MPDFDPIGDLFRKFTTGRPKDDVPQETTEGQPREEPNSPEKAEPVTDTFDWLDVPDWARDEVEEKLREARADNEQQGLFYLGWMGDVSPDIRKAAREEYQQKYGGLTSDEWERWRDEVGSPEPGGEAVAA